MPLVFASRSEKVDDELFQKVRDALPGIIAKNLDVPEHPLARLVPEDIEIKHLGSAFDIGHFDVEVTILATKFEARIETGQLRSDQMSLELEAVLPEGMTGFVWLVLVDAFFSTFGAKREERKLRVLLLESSPDVRRDVIDALRRRDFDVQAHPDPENLASVLELARTFKPDVTIMGWRRFGPRVLKPLKELSSQVWIFSADAEATVRNEGGKDADRIFDKFHDWGRLTVMLKAVKPTAS